MNPPPICYLDNTVVTLLASQRHQGGQATQSCSLGNFHDAAPALSRPSP